MHPFGKLRDERGAAALEFAIAAPVLLSMVIGLAQLGIMYSASTGVRNAVEEGARLAAVYPTPSDADIEARMLAARFMIDKAVADPEVTRGTTEDGEAYVDVRLRYSVPLNFVFFSTPPVTIDYSRRVFRQVDIAGRADSVAPVAPGPDPASPPGDAYGTELPAGNGKGGGKKN